MNFKNLAENLIIVIISALVGGAIAYKASTQANKQTITLLTPTLKDAIAKETTAITNEITHDIKLEIDKLKKTESIDLNINQNPNTSQKPSNKVVNKELQSSCVNGSVCIPIKNLTRRQKRRLDLN